MTAVIFGISGQDGYYLSQLLQKKGIKVIGVSRNNSKWIIGSVGDYFFVENIIKQYLPHYVFHFAANSTTNHEAIFQNHDTISTGTLNICEAVYRYSKHTKVFLSGSAVQFKNSGQPINENTPFASLSPYAVSRIQSVYAGRYFRDLGVQVYIGYFFNHDSPYRLDQHVNKLITNTINRIKNGSREVLSIKNWDIKKEFNFAEDVIEAIWILMNQTSVNEVIVGCGKTYSIYQWIEICCQVAGIPEAIGNFRSSMEQCEYNILISNPSKIFNLGWKPKTTIEDLAFLMLSDGEKK